MSFLDIVEEDVERSASDDSEGGDKKPDFINCVPSVARREILDSLGLA